MLHKAMILNTAYLKKHLPQIKDGLLRDDLLEHSTLKTFPAGQTILTDKQYIDYIPLITRGGAKVVHYTNEHKTFFLYFLREGETCAMTLSSCLKRETSRIRAKTIAETEIILVPVERVYYYTRHFASWNEFVLISFQAKFDSILNAFEGMAFAPLEQRVLKYLQGMATIIGLLEIDITHGDLAVDLGVSRVGISRVLKNLENKGTLKLGRKTIQLIGFTGKGIT
jgi:CRP/FNR family transcriptional regulator